MTEYSVKEFILDVEKIVRSQSSEIEVLKCVKPILERLISREGTIPSEAFNSRKDRYAMNLIYMPKDSVFSVIGANWLPGQATLIHDHMTWTLIGMYEGEENETIYKRLDDNSNQERAKLEKVSELINRKGHVTALDRTGIHRVENISEKPSWSVHVYGNDIGKTKRHTYDPATGKISIFITGYDKVLKLS